MSQESLTLRCESCEHAWNARNTQGTSRQCSKCHSRQIVEVSGNDASPSPMTTPQKAEVVAEKASLPPLLKDDPDVRQKLKELELAKLDRQIQEIKTGTPSDMVMERLAINHIELLFYLHQNGTITDDTHASLISYCPWCGASDDDGPSYEDTGQGGYRCATCGHWVPN